MGANFSSVNLRVVEIDSSSGSSVTNNNTGIYGYGYTNIGFNEPIPFLEAEVTNGTGINFSPNTPASISLAPNATYFASYNFIACPLTAGLPVRVILSLNNDFLEQSLSLAPALTDLSTVFTSAAGSAVFNTGSDSNQILQLINNTNTPIIKFLSANINIMQIG